MTRNISDKRPPIRIKVKVNKRRASDASSSLDLSDEGGYSDLEDISDSDEDDDEHVNAAEEAHLRKNRAHHNNARSSPRPPSPSLLLDNDDDQGDDEAGEEDNDDDDDDDEDDDDEEVLEDDDDEDAASSVSWNGLSDHQDVASAGAVSVPETTERRVRFDVPDSSDGDSTETDDDVDQALFPDLFVPQSSLDPTFRRELERNDDDEDDNSSNSGIWDFYDYNDDVVSAADYGSFMMPFDEEGDSSTPVATPMASHDLSTANSSAVPSPDADDVVSVDGEISDDGDTTDEDELPTKLPRRKSRKDKADASSDSESVTLIRPRRGQPRVGRFDLDSSTKKPVAIVNPRTGKLMIFHPQGRGFDLSPEQFNFQWFDTEPESPMVNSGNMMMSAMVSSNTFGDFMNTQAIGPEEAFFFPADNTAIEESSEPDEPDDDFAAERKLQLEDFITFEDNDGSSDEDDNNPLDLDEDPFFATPARPTTATSDVTSLLDHFETNGDVVGAFRRDQANHQLISRSKATRDSLAFSGPYFEGTLRGIKEGRIQSTNVPISPLRKSKKASVDMTSSPLAGASQKRKASSDHHPQQQWGHKRQRSSQRSIPDVNLLSI